MKKKKNNFFEIIIFVAFIILIGSILAIFFWINDNHKNKEIEDEVKYIYQGEYINLESNYLVNPPFNELDKTWYYKDLPFVDVNILDLQKENSDTVGYISLEGTKISYPVVQTVDNEYYLNHTFDKSESKAGWIFVDFRNKLDELDYNTVIYGHRRTDESMFGSLKYVLESDWLNNLDNHIINFSTEKYNLIWQVFSVYTIAQEKYYIKTYFTNDDKYQEFLNTIKERSIYDFGTEVNTKDKIITLSTCQDELGINRVVLHAKLLKKMDK